MPLLPISMAVLHESLYHFEDSAQFTVTAEISVCELGGEKWLEWQYING